LTRKLESAGVGGDRGVSWDPKVLGTIAESHCRVGEFPSAVGSKGEWDGRRGGLVRTDLDGVRLRVGVGLVWVVISGLWVGTGGSCLSVKWKTSELGARGRGLTF